MAFWNKKTQETQQKTVMPIAPIIEAMGKITTSFTSIKTRESQAKTFHEVSEIYSVVMYMARAFSNIKPKLLQVDSKLNKSVEITSHEILDVLAKPNTLSNWTDFLIQHYISKKVFGNSYIYQYVPSGFSAKAKSLWVLPAQYTYAIPVTAKVRDLFNGQSKDDFVRGYGFFTSQIDYRKTPTWAADEVMHLREPNIKYSPTTFDQDLIEGRSPLETLTEPISNIRKAYEAQNVILTKRGALGILTPKNNKDSIGNASLTDKDKKNLQEEFQQYGLGKDDWQYIISNVELVFQPMALPIRELMLFEGIENSMTAICNTYNFPKVLLNYLQGSTYSNVGELKKSLYQDNIIPEANAFMNQLSNFLGLPEKGLLLKADFSHVPILQEDAKTEAEKDEILVNMILSIQQNITSGAISIDSGKAIMNNILSFSNEQIDEMLTESSRNETIQN